MFNTGIIFDEQYYHNIAFLACLFAVMNISFAITSVDAREGQGIVLMDLIKTPGAVGPVAIQINTRDGTAIGNV